MHIIHGIHTSEIEVRYRSIVFLEYLIDKSLSLSSIDPWSRSSQAIEYIKRTLIRRIFSNVLIIFQLQYIHCTYSTL